MRTTNDHLGCLGELADAHLCPLTGSIPLAPTRSEPGTVTHLWRYGDLRRLSELVHHLSRNDGVPAPPLALANPGLGGTPRTTRTLTVAVGHLPRGTHPCASPRFAGVRVLMGNALFTPTNGPAVHLSRGDLLRTRNLPSGEWQPGGDAGVLWFDVLDLPLLSTFDTDIADAPRAGPAPCLRIARDDPCSPKCGPLPYVHRWTETEDLLTATRPNEKTLTSAVRYGDARLARDLTPTLRVEVHRLHPGPRTPSIRTNQSAIAVALNGAGTSVVGGWRLRWHPGDAFVIPPGAPADHHVATTSDLLMVSDAPTLQALHLWWSQTLPEHQAVEDVLQ